MRQADEIEEFVKEYKEMILWDFERENCGECGIVDCAKKFCMRWQDYMWERTRRKIDETLA